MAGPKPITIPITYRSDTLGLKKAAGALGVFGGTVAAIAVAAVASLAKIGAEATRMAAEFETSFAKIEGLVGVSKDQLGELEAAAARLGPQFGKSATEAADALFFITSAGLRGEDAINVLEASLKGAAIGLGETKTIADLATSAVNAYGASQLDGAKAVDVLTEAVRLGKLEPDALAQSMGQVLPLASNLGVSFAEVGAAMAGMSKTGTDASTAATQLRQILSTIAKPTAEAERQLASMGLSAEGLRQQIREEGLYDTLYGLTEAFDGNIEATSTVFGNIRALSGVLDLMGASAEDNRELFAQMTDETGVLDDALETAAQTAEFKLARTMESLRATLLPVGDVLLEIGSTALDAFMPIIDELGPVLLETFQDLAPSLGELVSGLLDLFSASLPLLPIFGDITQILLDLLTLAIAPLVPLFESLMPLIEILAESVSNFLSEAFEMLTPILTQIGELLGELLEALLPPIIVLFDALAPVVLELIEAFLPLLELILPVLTDLIENLVVPALLLAAGILEDQLPRSVGYLTGTLEGFLPFLEGFVTGFGIIFNVLIDVVYSIVNGIVAAIEGFANFFVDAINKMIQGINKLRAEVGKKPIDLIARVSLQPLEKPGKYDFLRFPEVDTTGISDLATRQQALAAERAASLSGSFNVDTSSLAGLRAASSTRGFYTDSFGNTVFGNVPMFARGGIVSRPTIGVIGEAGPEAVVPLGSGRMGATYNITVNAGIGANGSQVGEEIINAIKRYERRSGPVFARA